MTKDLRHALRLIRNDLGFSLAVMAVMAFSIGACTAIFSVGKAVLFTRLPYSSPDRLVILWHTVAGRGAGVVGMSPHDYTIYRDTARSFESVAAVFHARVQLEHSFRTSARGVRSRDGQFVPHVGNRAPPRPLV